MLLFLVALSTLSGVMVVYSEVCNPVECFSQLTKVFQHTDDSDSCNKITIIEHCINLCQPVGIDNSIIKGVQEVKQEICENDQDNKLFNKCVDKYKYLLLFCLYENFNLNALNPKSNPKLLMCRKISEAQQCDQSTLVACPRHSNYVAEVLLEKLFKPLHSEFCTFSNEEIYQLNVTYPVFANDYKKLAQCFDLNSHLVDECVSNKGAKNSVISSFFSSKLCNTVENFLDCLHDLVKENCHSQEIALKIISQSLYQNILPKCFPFSNSNKASKGKLVNNKFTDASGKPFRNSSDTLNVHQHVVITAGHNNDREGMLWISMLIESHNIPSLVMMSTEEEMKPSASAPCHLTNTSTSRMYRKCPFT